MNEFSHSTQETLDVVGADVVLADDLTAPLDQQPTAMSSVAPLLSAGIGLGLSACGGGGSSAPVVLTPPTHPANEAEAARFLLHAQFSASDSEIAQVQSLGYSAWLDTQMAVPIAQTAWDWLMAKGYNTTTFVNSTTPADYVVWQQLIQSNDAVRKRVALALSEIFVVSSNGINISSRAFAMAHYWDVLQTHALGNFRNLLEEISLNPAMGIYLNIKGNQKANTATGRVPDENYAREVLQLFTIGLYELNLDGTYKLNAQGKPIETYDQAEISQLARVFTGYDFDATGSIATTNPLNVKNRMVVNNSLHETGSSSFLGVTVAAGASASAALGIALDAMFNHPNTAPFFCKQMIQRLVTSNPSAAYVRRVVDVFINNGANVRGDLKAVVKAILLDYEARSSTLLTSSQVGKLREPMVRFVQWAKTFAVTTQNDEWKIGDFSNAASRLGQSPLRAPSVFNFFRPGYVAPNTNSAQQGLVAPEMQLCNETSVSGYLNFMLTTIKSGYNPTTGGILPPAYTQELTLANDVSALIERLDTLLTGKQLSSSTLALITTGISNIAAPTLTGQQNRVYATIFLIMASPEYIAQK